MSEESLVQHFLRQGWMSREKLIREVMATMKARAKKPMDQVYQEIMEQMP